MYLGGELVQFRLASLAPNKKDCHDDDNSDDTNSYISKRGNSTSSQGNGQQSGNGQNSTSNQSSAGHQAGGSHISNRGIAGQGSSAGGDGNDEEDKEKKIKQAKDGDQQDKVSDSLAAVAIVSG